MEQCEFCGNSLPANVSFCGKCGRVPRQTAQQATRMSDISPFRGDGDIDEQPTKSLESNWSQGISVDTASTNQLPGINLLPLDANQQKEEEEEKRRRAALLGLGLLGAMADQSPLGHIPTVQGTPQVQQIASFQGTPQLQQPGMAPGHAFGPSAPAGPGTGLPTSTPVHPGPIQHFPGHPPHMPPGPQPGGSGLPGPKPGGGAGSSGGPSGCLVGGIVAVVSIVLILGSVIGLGLTVWAPSLALSGSASVEPGGTLSVHGSGFLPNSSITLTLDNNMPIYYLLRNVPRQVADEYAPVADSAEQMLLQSNGSHNTVLARGDGTFAISFQIDPSWSLGRHTLHASELPTHRSAALPFNIAQVQVSPTATSSTSTPSATPDPGVTPTLTANTSLNCASPANLALGPVSELSAQVATGGITLCTSGSGTVTWNASWNASWLSLSQKSGTIQAPNQMQITATAAAGNLAAGNYNTTITFSNSHEHTTRTVAVSFTVQTGCVNATPPRMVFNGVASVSDPSGSQTISVTNCGLSSGWSAKIRNGSTWLSISPSGGTLNGGASDKITVTASNLDAGLSAGSYTDFIDVTIGSKKSSVIVILNVQPQPLISVSPTIVPNASCRFNEVTGGDNCPVTLSNSSNSQSLSWSWTATDINGVTISSVTVQAPNGTTIGAGASEGVTIVIGRGTPCRTIHITFTGPGPNNTATVTYECG